MEEEHGRVVGLAPDVRDEVDAFEAGEDDPLRFHGPMLSSPAHGSDPGRAKAPFVAATAGRRPHRLEQVRHRLPGFPT